MLLLLNLQANVITQVKADVDHINKLIENGADVHATDDVGQNLMHEVARYHTPEICFLFLKFDINIQLGQWWCFQTGI